MKIFHACGIAFGVALLLGSAALSTCRADTGLPIVLTGCSDGAAFTSCTGGKYARPLPTDLVKECNSATVSCYDNGAAKARLFSALGPTATLDTCVLDVPVNSTVPFPWAAASDPCIKWQPVFAASFVPITGQIRVTWAHDGVGVTGFWIYSAASGNALSKLKQVIGTARSTDLAGFSPGSYTFAVTALSGTLESDLSASVSVVIPAKKPTTASNVTATIR